MIDTYGISLLDIIAIPTPYDFLHHSQKSVYSSTETEDGVQTDAGQILECGGDAGLLRAHSIGPTRLH